jgi:FkbM family methyltransferase
MHCSGGRHADLLSSIVMSVSIGSLPRRINRLLRNTDGIRTQRLRWYVFPILARLTPFVGVEHEGVRYVLGTRDRLGVGYGTFVSGSFEKETLRRMLTALERFGITTLRGMTVLEVGANIGTETVSLLSHHGVERVVAFEPDADNARMLRANLALNGLDRRAEVHEIALSDVDATLMLERSAENCGDHRIRVVDAHGPDLFNEWDRSVVEVFARSIDSLVESGELDLDAVGLVWMDAQGHEGHVLAGAQKLIAARIPVLTEYWPYGLNRAGGLDRFHTAVAEGYGTVIDLRSNHDEPPVTLPADRVAELAERYSDEFLSYSDLLLIPG